jgi:hypothetical protein
VPSGYHRTVDELPRSPRNASDAKPHGRLPAFYVAGFGEQVALAREMVPLVYEP